MEVHVEQGTEESEELHDETKEQEVAAETGEQSGQAEQVEQAEAGEQELEVELVNQEDTTEAQAGISKPYYLLAAISYPFQHLSRIAAKSACI